MKRRNFVKATTAAAAAGMVGMTIGCKPGETSQPRSEDEMTGQALRDSLDEIFGKHMDAELEGDLDKTMATMSPDPHLVNVPTMIGGKGPAGVRRFYANRLIGQFFPPDVEFETISSTYSPERLVSELIISFTHTIEMGAQRSSSSSSSASRTERSRTNTFTGTRPTCWSSSA
jgi:carboxymethylenebutenolidase